MDFDPEGISESLIPPSQEKTAQRTRHLLVATRLAFVFSHGALVVSASAALGWEADESWWVAFIPVWLGDSLCLVLIVGSWFASCPYIQLCLSEHQARLGYKNPSILTEILPDIVLAFVGLVFMILALVAEILLCTYLDRRQHGEPHSFVPSAVVLCIVASLACCRGICIQTSSALFGFFGAGVLATVIAALCFPGGLFGESGWVLVMPSCVSTTGLLVAAARRMRGCKPVLSREERMLRIAEQLVLLGVLVALLLLATLLALGGAGLHLQPGRCGAAASAAATAGCGVCIVALLRARMAVVESRLSSVRERCLAWQIMEASSRTVMEAAIVPM